MRCPEERRRLFFTLFVTQVSCPAQLDRRQDTPSFWSSSHNLSSFACCVCGTSPCSVLRLLLIIYRSVHLHRVFVPVCLSICRLLLLSVFEPFLLVQNAFCKRKLLKKKIIALTCWSGIGNNCWFLRCLKCF